jgi:uncharacterized protein YjlB
VYREILSTAPTAESARELIEKNHWFQGGNWKAFKTHHFHSVTHESYAAFKGRSRLLLDRGPLDGEDAGMEVDIEAGDVIVLPVRHIDPQAWWYFKADIIQAGVSHCSLTSEGDYSYVGLYPVSKHYDDI